MGIFLLGSSGFVVVVRRRGLFAQMWLGTGTKIPTSTKNSGRLLKARREFLVPVGIFGTGRPKSDRPVVRFGTKIAKNRNSHLLSLALRLRHEA